MAIYWLTGQPGSGKTTLAKWIYSVMMDRKIIIDGDDIRDIFENKDYTESGRRKNIELAQNISLFLHNKGFDVIVSMVSPYRDQRENFKERMKGNIEEFYIHCTDERGREHFHVSNYEPPIDCFTDIDTTIDDEYTSFKKIREKLNI